jgi:UDP-glucose 4-epimerase
MNLLKILEPSSTLTAAQEWSNSAHKLSSVLVTGGAGFIGSHLVDSLVSCGYHVKVLDNLSTGRLVNIQTHLETGKIDFIEGDITDADLVRNCVREVSAVVHLAAVVNVPFSFWKPQLTRKINVEGTMNLFRSSVEEKADKFVFISSCAVYGEPKYLPIDESHPFAPISPYAQAKLEAEQSCLRFSKTCSTKLVVLLLFNVYGPRQGVNDYSGVITQFISRIKKNQPLTIYGDGTQTRDFVNVHDVVNAIVSIMENNEADGEVFNVGSGKPVTIRELAETTIELAGAKTRIKRETSRLGDIKHSHADISKARDILGYEPRIQLKDGLSALFEQLLPANKSICEGRTI